MMATAGSSVILNSSVPTQAVQNQMSSDHQSSSNVKSKEYYVRVPKTKKRYHALKFHTTNVDLASWSKAEMVRDTTNLPQSQKQEWEALPKNGVGSEYGREAKELARRRKYTSYSKKNSIEDMPWIITSKGSEKDKGKERQYLGKKSVSENSSYFVFVKIADGGFEAHPLEDWYAFAPHKTYKTLNIEEAEEEFKRRHKILNKCLIMANKRKNQENEFDDDEEEKKDTTRGLSGGSKALSGGSKANDDDKPSTKKKNYNKSSNLSDDDDELGKSDDDDMSKNKKGGRRQTKSKTAVKKSAKKREYTSDDEFNNKEDSDDGDHEGLEKDYSSSGTESESEPETSKFIEKYQQKGIDEEEAIKALDKSDDEESEDEELTEQGKEYKRKLMSKGIDDEEENDSDDMDELFKNGKSEKDKNDEDSKDSVSSLDDLDLDDISDKQKKSKAQASASSASQESNKLKRKATDAKAGKEKIAKKQQGKSGGAASAQSAQDESLSSSSASNPINQQTKSNKTAAIIAAAQAANAANAASSMSNNTATSSSKNPISNGSGVTEEEVRRYLSRKPMTTKELFHKFRSKTQNTMTKEELFQALKIILDKLKCKITEQNGSKYLSLP